MKRLTLSIGPCLLLFTSLAMATNPAQNPAGKLPDFTVEKIYLTKGCHVAGVIKNLGPGGVPDEVWNTHAAKSAGVYLHRNGKEWGGATIWKFDPTKHLQTPGGTAAFISNLSVTGSNTIKLEVDIRDVVPEADESNNSMEVKLACKATPGEPESETTRSYWYDPPIVLPLWPIWDDLDIGSGTPIMCERCILNCMGDHSYEYCRRMCERAGRCKPITPRTTK
jgi:hypothetical protein